ncbi:peptide chain release factor 2 [Candidatus Falkowbacteria bacterium]|uniref:Peptide chain release factor 2 n=1 Tax=Candidatus Buchananbacteria bacterium CG10_big_fil_rev_8_21_14_0_10_33_19 TaxID=1974525 RepID=A0A2H0W2Y9_9BACT|nr:peptide chain release factor 2 [Candidatus Falkowbacteria bacterium]PIS05708.1 MAG: peptide chain release factor 2 [Candidatus Buchananbacteria bacterium CG10_big_fil_rev_8_21_14_0_10_33_19]
MKDEIIKLKELQDSIFGIWRLLSLDKQKAELIDLEIKISAPGFWDDVENAKTLSKKYEDIKSEIEAWGNLKKEVDELLSLAEITKDAGELQDEITSKLEKLIENFKKLEFSVLFSGEHDKGSALLSIHAGTGGVDAQDWSQILLRMYFRFCEKHNFAFKIIDQVDGAEAGIKSVVIEVTGRYSYGWLKSENGVHRLVRISPFDGEGLRHTSFALVEVLPEMEDSISIEIKDDDLRIDVMRAGGNGGQSVNTTDSAVRITHLPTNIVVKCQTERSQLQNKNNAMKILKAKLLKHYELEEEKRIQRIKGEYQKAEWGNQARSYVMQPYKLVKDHRTGYETQEVDKVLDGDLNDFVEEYLRSQVPLI